MFFSDHVTNTSTSKTSVGVMDFSGLSGESGGWCPGASLVWFGSGSCGSSLVLISDLWFMTACSYTLGTPPPLACLVRSIW